MVAPDGERTMFTDRGANLRLRRADLPARLLDGAAVLHLTGYTFFEPSLLEVALWLLEQARSRDLAVTIDPASAAFLARLEPGAFLRWTGGAAVCFPNRDEAAVLAGEARPGHDGRPPDPALPSGAPQARGGRLPPGGARRGSGPDPGPPGAGPDSTGAGDAFCGAFMSRWLAAGPASPAGASQTWSRRREFADAGRRHRRHPLGRPPV